MHIAFKNQRANRIKSESYDEIGSTGSMRERRCSVCGRFNKNAVAYIETSDENPVLINLDDQNHFVESIYGYNTTKPNRTRLVAKFCTNYVVENSVGSITYLGRNIESNDIIIDFGEKTKKRISKSAIQRRVIF